MVPGRRAASTRARSVALHLEALDDGLEDPVRLSNALEVGVEATGANEPPARLARTAGLALSLRARSRPSRAVLASRSSSSAGTPALAKCAAI